MKFDEVRAIDLASYQLALVHKCTGTDEKTTREITLRSPATPTGAGRISAQRLRDCDWVQRTFGPNCIRPSHSFFVVVIDRATGKQLGELTDLDDILSDAREIVWAHLNPEKAAALQASVDSFWKERNL